MGEAFAISQSSVILQQLHQTPTPGRRHLFRFNPPSVRFSTTKSEHATLSLIISAHSQQHKPIFSWTIRDASGIVSDSEEVQPDSTGGGDDFGGVTGGSGDGGGDSNEGGQGGSEESEDKSKDNKKMAFSMSQKLTLGYAALVGVGGVMGYLKSGSQKSLLAGGLSALLLYYVHTQLPARPVFASSLGLGLSAALLGVMGSRFKKSGKIFPAGVVSFVSLVMTGGYLHGILRTMH